MWTTEYCMNPRWQNIWMVMSLLFLGPAAFMAGFGLGGGLDGEDVAPDAVMNGIETGSGTIAAAPAGIFLKSDETIRSSDPSRCLARPSIFQPITVCLKMQPTGNLLLYQWFDEDTDKIVLWNTQVNLRSGDYYSKLQDDGNLVTTRGTIEAPGSVVWSSKSTSVIETDYLLVLDNAATGLQIVRSSADGISSSQTMWSSTSTLFASPSMTTAPTQISMQNPTAPVQVPVAPVAPPPVDVPVASPIAAFVPVSVPETGWEADNPSPPTTETERDDFGDEDSISLPWSSAPASSRYDLRSGPMVGHTTDQTVKIWALQGEGRAMEMIYRQVDQSMARSINMPPNADQGAAVLDVEGLQPNTRYQFELRIDGEQVGTGEWKTAPSQGQPTDFHFLLASCMDVKGNRYPRQPVWDRALSQAPDFAMLNGDTVYLNDGDWTASKEIILERVWARNLEQRDETHYKNFMSKVPMYATWDDHEFGVNNSHKDQPGKGNSLRAFTNLWAHPSAGTSSTEGVFYSYYWGDVHFIVCDNRWYRDLSTGTQWGTAQRLWIADQLRNSRAPFKIIVSGGDVMERDMSLDMDELGKVVTQSRVSGIIFCAGDIHRNEFKAMDHGNWPYPVTQITSSGIAREWRRPWAMVRVDTTQSDPAVYAHFFGADSTAESTTWGNDPNLRCSSIQGLDRYQEHRCTEVIRLSQLKA